MNTQLKDLMSLADNYAQECVYLECENQERRGIVDGSSVAAVDESRQWLENELRRLCAAEADFHMAYRVKCDEQTKVLHAENEALRALLPDMQSLCMEVRQQCGPRLVALAIPLYAAIDAARSET